MTPNGGFLYDLFTMKNLCGKTRDVNNPYEVYRNGSGWEWRVLKKYVGPDKEPGNPLSDPKKVDPEARWFCAVKSPMTHGTYDLGDEYVLNVIRHGVRIDLPVFEKW